MEAAGVVEPSADTNRSVFASNSFSRWCVELCGTPFDNRARPHSMPPRQYMRTSAVM